jgi:hypothetical protein
MPRWARDCKLWHESRQLISGARQSVPLSFWEEQYCTIKQQHRDEAHQQAIVGP